MIDFYVAGCLIVFGFCVAGMLNGTISKPDRKRFILPMITVIVLWLPLLIWALAQSKDDY